MLLSRIVALEALPGGRLRLSFEDGAAGVADLSPFIAAGGVFASLGNGTVAIVESGRAIAWRDPDGDEADMDADTLRRLIVPAQAAAQ